MESKEQERHKIVLRTYLENPDLSHRAIGRKLEIVQSTVSRVLNRYNERLTVDREKKSGQNGSPCSEKDHKRVVQAFKRNPNSSVRDVAKKLQLSKTFVQDAKKREGLHTYKVQKAPNRNERQNTVGKSRARKLYTQMLTKPHCLIMDDETYVKADFRQLPGLLFFTAHHKFDVPEDVRKQKMSKFEEKNT